MSEAEVRPSPTSRPAGAAAIEVSHLTKDFGGRTAVADVSFSVARGEVFGFLGPNGAGKTTTVRMLGTLIAPTAGSAVVGGIPLGPASAAEIRQRISIMPEAPGLYLRLTVDREPGVLRAAVRPARAGGADQGGPGGGRPGRPRGRPHREPVQGAAAAGRAGPHAAERPGGHVP